jgi:hypothetical protein
MQIFQHLYAPGGSMPNRASLQAWASACWVAVAAFSLATKPRMHVDGAMMQSRLGRLGDMLALALVDLSRS